MMCSRLKSQVASTAPGASTVAGEHHAIAVIGAGPRGTSVLERICASAPELVPGGRVTVHMVDPAPPGPGQVWRTAQPDLLLMNTVASQVTLFTDGSVECEGPVRPGPSLYEWAADDAAVAVGPDEYPPRALYGRYLTWFFRHVVDTAPPNVTVEVHASTAVELGDDRVRLADGTVLDGLGAVVLAQGHVPAAPTAEERGLAAHAAAWGLRWFAPANPADLGRLPGPHGTLPAGPFLDDIAPGEPVLLRGLGLNFFDHMALLTQGRGGRFAREGGALVYQPSGREPRLYAGSRRGVPYHARGDNEKGALGRHLPTLLSPHVIAQFRKRADAGDRPDFLREVWPLVAKEVEAVYYTALLAARGRDPERFRARFLDAEPGGAREEALLAGAGIGAGERWDWERVARPYLGRVFTGQDDYRGWLLEHLRQDVREAGLGNVRGPLKAAVDVLRDLRNEVRQIVDHAGVSGQSRRDHLERWYTPLNAHLSIGPPRRRVEELIALVEAGVVDVLGPGLTVRAVDGAFVAASRVVPGPPVAVRTLIEARLPETDLRRTTDPLLSALLAAGRCRPHTVPGSPAHETGGLDVTSRPYHVVDREGRPHPRWFACGVPTEGVHWVTAAGARPGVNSVTLCDTDAVARAALRAAPAPIRKARETRTRA
jgi:uncharacterized NAD(P)/FAD-binding protein YdhS